MKNQPITKEAQEKELRAILEPFRSNSTAHHNLMSLHVTDTLTEATDSYSLLRIPATVTATPSDHTGADWVPGLENVFPTSEPIAAIPLDPARLEAMAKAFTRLAKLAKKQKLPNASRIILEVREGARTPLVFKNDSKAIGLLMPLVS
jgi:hypothetical protein